MSTGTDYRPRLSIELEELQYRKLQKAVPWGLLKPLFSAIVDDINDMADAGLGHQLIAAIIAGVVKPRDVIKTLNTGDTNGNPI